MKPTSRYMSTLDQKRQRRWRPQAESIIDRTRRILDTIDANRKETH